MQSIDIFITHAQKKKKKINKKYKILSKLLGLWHNSCQFSNEV